MENHRLNIYERANGERTTLPYHLPAAKSGRIEVVHETAPKGKRLTVVSTRNALLNGSIPASITLENDTIIHRLVEYEQSGARRAMWMSTSPQEIEQATRQLARAKGNVLVGGLGLGLAVALLRQNPKVKTIVVVENNEDVIKLVWKHVPRPFYLIKADLFNYLRSLHGNGKRARYDFAFYDVWCPTGQWTWSHYVKPLRQLSIGVVPQAEIECWNEDEMLGQTRLSCFFRVGIEYGLFPDVHTQRVFEMTDKEFAQIRRANRDYWPFMNWMRHVRPTREEATAMLDTYMAALKDAVQWQSNWGKYEHVVRPRESSVGTDQNRRD